MTPVRRLLALTALTITAAVALFTAAVVALDTMSNPLLAVLLYAAAFVCAVIIATETDQS